MVKRKTVITTIIVIITVITSIILSINYVDRGSAFDFPTMDEAEKLYVPNNFQSK